MSTVWGFLRCVTTAINLFHTILWIKYPIKAISAGVDVVHAMGDTSLCNSPTWVNLKGREGGRALVFPSYIGKWYGAVEA